MEKVTILEAANKAIEWFNLNLAAVSSDDDEAPAEEKSKPAKVPYSQVNLCRRNE